MLEGLCRQARCPVCEVPAAAAPGHAPGEVGVDGHPEERLPNVDDLDADPHEAWLVEARVGVSVVGDRAHREKTNERAGVSCCGMEIVYTFVSCLARVCRKILCKLDHFF